MSQRDPSIMTATEIRAELADLSSQWDKLRASVEEDGGSGGSPGEWITAVVAAGGYLCWTYIGVTATDVTTLGESIIGRCDILP